MSVVKVKVEIAMSVVSLLAYEFEYHGLRRLVGRFTSCA
jgi:hypothetical protein